VPRNLAVGLSFGQLGVADEIPRPGGDKAQPDDAIARAGEQRVTRDLLLDEARVGFVFVQRADDVVAVRPGVRPWLVFVVAVGVGVMDDIQPMPRPVLSVTL